jgi:GNAT superfamily N-acetyltransferase
MTVFQFSAPIRDTGSSTTVRLRDGLAELRPLLPGEEQPLRRVFDAMTLESRASRYLTGLSQLPGPMLRALTAVDGVHHVAWLATIEGRPAGIGRYVRTDPCTAEVAFEVVDAHHGRGLGTALVDTLTTVAAVSGIRRVTASVLPSNAASIRLLEQVGIRLRPCFGVLEGTGDLRLLDPARVDRPAVVRLALAARSGPNGSWSERRAGAQ